MTEYKVASDRKHCLEVAPKQFEKIAKMISEDEYRAVNNLTQTWNDDKCLRYTITLLCDALVELTNLHSES